MYLQDILGILDDFLVPNAESEVSLAFYNQMRKVSKDYLQRAMCLLDRQSHCNTSANRDSETSPEAEIDLDDEEVDLITY